MIQSKINLKCCQQNLILLHLESKNNMENLFAGLFPNDYGEESPNWINSFQARSMVNGKAGEMGKPYLWAQRLAGLDFTGLVKMTSHSSINTEFVESVRLFYFGVNSNATCIFLLC